MMTISQIITDYQATMKQYPDTCLTGCANKSSIEEAIKYAVESKDENGKHHGHQYRIRKTSYPAFEDKLLSISESLLKTHDFEELLKAINENNDVPGIGELAVYDVAERIGVFLGPAFAPQDIYLHSGTRKGARKLGLKTRYKNGLQYITIADILQKYPALGGHGLTASEFENILCMYKDEF